MKKYSDFKIKGIDVAAFQGVIDWSKVDADFIILRIGYGQTIDAQFIANLKGARALNKIIIFYWYGDYYSNWYIPKSGYKAKNIFGMGDQAWGEKQAEICWNAIKEYGAFVFLDCESGGAEYSAPLTEPETKKHAQIIYRAFLERLDELSGRFNGIYTSVGWLGWFQTALRNRPLWVAWYNRYISIQDVFDACLRYGWEGMVVIWQFASDGDLDGNGTSDGIKMGMKTADLDLNGWIGTEAQLKVIFSRILSSGDTPDDEAPVIIPAPDFMLCVITASSLSIRAQPSIKSTFLGSRIKGTPVKVSPEILKGSGSVRGWVKVLEWVKVEGQDEYLSLDYLK